MDDQTVDDSRSRAGWVTLPLVGPDCAHGIRLGPDHPTLDGAPDLGVRIQDGIIVDAELQIGSVHRGVEKLVESRDYRAILTLLDRHDWLSPFSSEIGLAVALEQMLGIAVPFRAELIRILLCEMTRVAHHLAFLASLPGDHDLGRRAALWQVREALLDQIEAGTGQRIHPMFTVVGGVHHDLSTDWIDGLATACTDWARLVPGLLGGSMAEAIHGGFADKGVLTNAAAHAFGASGPVARASGLDLDIRRDAPYLPYPPDLLEIPVRNCGDALARVQCLADEVPISLRLIEWAIAELSATTGTPVNVRLPKTVRAPEGSTYVMTENPSGINAYYLVSRNDPMPWRLKLRTAGFNNAQALGAALAGTHLDDAPAVIASFFLTPGDIDR